MPLAIINREPNGGSIPPGVPVWRTCLREVLFAPSADTFEHTAGSTRLDGRAYRLLLEILCGLQSPMIGETQVVAQFKAFLAALPQEHAWIRRTGQRLLADARQVRTAHLQGLGSRSYGSAVRRCIGPSETPVLIGTGKLATDILPYLTETGRTVDQWGRAPAFAEASAFAKASASAEATADKTADRTADKTVGKPRVQLLRGVSYRSLESLDSFPATDRPAVIVVAAPAPSTTLARAAAAYRGLTRVVDLRAEAEADPLVTSVPTITLRDLFALMDDADKFVLTQIEAARAEIADRSRRYEQRDEVRPFGWDDLCA